MFVLVFTLHPNLHCRPSIWGQKKCLLPKVQRSTVTHLLLSRDLCFYHNINNCRIVWAITTILRQEKEEIKSVEKKEEKTFIKAKLPCVLAQCFGIGIIKTTTTRFKNFTKTAFTILLNRSIN